MCYCQLQMTFQTKPPNQRNSHNCNLVNDAGSVGTDASSNRHGQRQRSYDNNATVARYSIVRPEQTRFQHHAAAVRYDLS